MADGLVDERAVAGEAPGEQAAEAGYVPLNVWADTMPEPVPSIADGHPVELGAPQVLRPKWWDRLLGTVLGKAVSALNEDRDRIQP